MGDTRDELLERWLESPRLNEPYAAPKAPSNALGEAFMAELSRSWETYGKSAIERIANLKPEIYLKLVASFVSEDVKPSGAFNDLNDSELGALIMAARAALKAHERAGSSGSDSS
jgi:hypothetical protein